MILQFLRCVFLTKWCNLVKVHLQTRNGVKLLDGCCTESRQCTKDRALDFCNFCILHCIHQCVLSLCCMILRFLRCVFLTKWCNLVKVHLQVMGHFLSQVVLWRPKHSTGSACNEHSHYQCCAHHCSSIDG